jgi:prepilin-type N-terminal cleavage/methylation domain-containing protein
MKILSPWSADFSPQQHRIQPGGGLSSSGLHLRRGCGLKAALPVNRIASQRGFTMIEIAIAIAVIGFALVAIIGILPRGLEVQRDNRSETIINQDGTFWLEAIRNGARGMNELPAYVEQVDVVLNGNTQSYSNFNTGAEVIGRLTEPAAALKDPAVTSAFAVARVWAISGAAVEKDPAREIGFKYLLRVQFNAATNSALSFLENTRDLPAGSEPLLTLYDLNVELLYPLTRPGLLPSRLQSFRAQASRNVVTNLINNTEYYFFAP